MLESKPFQEVYIKAILQDDMPDCTVCALNEILSSFDTF
jgi:hypothetical protein